MANESVFFCFMFRSTRTDCAPDRCRSRSGQLRGAGTGLYVRLAAAGAAERGGRGGQHRPAAVSLRRRAEPIAGGAHAVARSPRFNYAMFHFNYTASDISQPSSAVRPFSCCRPLDSLLFGIVN